MKIFHWTLGAKRPLLLRELQEVVGVHPGDSLWDKQKISAALDGRHFLEPCGAFMLLDETDNSVQFAHHTVAQFLRDTTCDRIATDWLLADTCMTYVNFSDFETQITLANKERPIIKWDSPNQSPFFRILQFMGISQGVYDFLFGIYNRGHRRLLPDVDYAELLKNVRRTDTNAPLDQKYQLLNYIKRHWIWHTTTFAKQDSKKWTSFRDLVFHKELMFELRPWGFSQGPAEMPHLTVFLWALEAAHKPLLALLAEITPLKKYSKHDSFPLLNQLILEGRLEIFEFVSKRTSLRLRITA